MLHAPRRMGNLEEKNPQAAQAGSADSQGQSTARSQPPCTGCDRWGPAARRVAERTWRAAWEDVARSGLTGWPLEGGPAAEGQLTARVSVGGWGAGMQLPVLLRGLGSRAARLEGVLRAYCPPLPGSCRPMSVGGSDPATATRTPWSLSRPSRIEPNKADYRAQEQNKRCAAWLAGAHTRTHKR